jgi:hypothetical protein
VLGVTFRGTFGGFRARQDSGSGGERRAVPSCFKHYDRVLVGADRAKGRLLKCERKPPATGSYFKVKTDAGDWRWPDVLILDRPGAHVGTCEAGGGRFMTDQQGDGLLCPKHDGEVFGTPEDHALDAAAPRRPSGNTTRWKRGRR